MLMVSWWFIVLIVNCLFYSLIDDADGSSKKWLIVSLTIIDVALIVFLFGGI